MLFGGIEAGGTKFVCAIGTGPDDLREITTIPTTTPSETFDRVVDYFKNLGHSHTPAAIGIGSFGPIDPDPASPTWGYITSTPKPGWTNTRFAGAIQEALGLPVSFDTDVNAAALGEGVWGAAQGLDTFIYLTIGTGIGGGGLLQGRMMHGLVHPEMGHMRIPHDRTADPYAGKCLYHGDCWEGLAAGPAVASRWGQPAETLPANHPAWPLEAKYLAMGVANIVCTLSPQRVIMGGGLMRQPQLWPMVRQRVVELLNGYIQAPAIVKEIDAFIVPPAMGDRAGILGAIALGQGKSNGLSHNLD
jgi:fructokinase